MRRFIDLAGLSVLLMCVLCSCTAKEEGVVQPYSAASNGAIAGRAVFGAKESETFFRHMAFSDDGALYFYGLLNGVWSIGRIEIDGDIPWHKAQRFFVKGLCAFEASIGAGGQALAALSNSEKSALDEPTYGIIDVYDQNGTLIIHTLVEDPDYDIRIESLRLVSKTPGNATFFAAGGARKEDTTYPFCALFQVMSDSTISFIKKRIFINLPNQYFIKAAWNANESSPAYFVSSSAGSPKCPDWQSSAAGTCWDDSIVCIDDALGIVWSRTIAPSNTAASDIRAIEYSDGTLYVIGEAETTKADGQQWGTGLVASVAESGVINWSKSIILSELSDCYYDLAVYQGTLYAVGEYAFMVQYATNRCYGYALLSRFKLPSGDLESHSTFGGARYSSGFRAIKINGNSAICGGWTNWHLDDCWFQGWLVDINLSLLQGGLTAPPVSAGAPKGSSLSPLRSEQ
jgi:hypothetical protein